MILNINYLLMKNNKAYSNSGIPANRLQSPEVDFPGTKMIPNSSPFLSSTTFSTTEGGRPAELLYDKRKYKRTTQEDKDKLLDLVLRQGFTCYKAS
jgi:hypothetical protein